MLKAMDKLTIKGFKSIKLLDEFEMKDINVLIGGNGAGKSNFIDFFRLLRAMLELPLPGLNSPSLKTFIANGGGCDDFLFNGPKVTDLIEAEMYFGDNGYRFKLATTADEKFIINDEETYFKKYGWYSLGSGNTTPELLTKKNHPGTRGGYSVQYYVHESIKSWQIYHFHDTSKTAAMRRSRRIIDDEYFRFTAANLAPFLLRLREEYEDAYNRIVETVKLVTPFFDDFFLKPNGAKEKVSLNWKQKGSDYPMQAYHLSDGTMRFICLATALLQPNSPSTLIIDEPELGLHPYAIEILAELIQSASKRTQVIVSTQSPALVDCFEPEDVIVVDRNDGASTFKRLDAENLKDWLDDYSLGDLWRKGIVAGGPVHE